MTELTIQEARQIAKDAYIYANPVVDSYRILYSYFVDEDSPDYKAPWNQIENIPRVYTCLLYTSDAADEVSPV